MEGYWQEESYYGLTVTGMREALGNVGDTVCTVRNGRDVLVWCVCIDKPAKVFKHSSSDVESNVLYYVSTSVQ